MIRYWLLLIFLPFISFGQSFDLKIVNGYGSGTFSVDDTVHIWSYNTDTTTLFSGWTSNGNVIFEAKDEWHTTLTVPPGTESVTVTASYKPIPNAIIKGNKDYQLFGLNGQDVSSVTKQSFYAIPPDPKALVILLHGTNGNGGSFFQSYEHFSIIKDFLFHGYAVCTLDANEVTMGDQNGDDRLRWYVGNAPFANTSNNVDIKNIQLLIDSLSNDFEMLKHLPVFSMGISNGAVFSDLCASALGFKASAHVLAKGAKEIYERDDIVPVIWIMSENDQNEHADNAAAYQNYLFMSDIQTAEFHYLRKSPVHLHRFERSLNGISAQKSLEIIQKLISLGYLDEDYYLNIEDTQDILVELLTGLGLSPSQRLEVRSQLKCLNAEHTFSSDKSNLIIHFFENFVNINPTENAKEFEKPFVVYPNPATDYLNIALDALDHPYKVMIQSVDGKIVTALLNSNSIDISALRKGMYLLKIESLGKVYCQKFIKL